MMMKNKNALLIFHGEFMPDEYLPDKRNIIVPHFKAITFSNSPYICYVSFK